MRKFTLLAFIAVFFISFGWAQSALVLTSVFDGPLPGGIPKGVEIYVKENISDLSIYGLGSANNGGGSDGEEFTFPAVSASAGDYIYITGDPNEFTQFFGLTATFLDTVSATNVNGDDAIELFMNGNVVDVYGDINVDGNGEPWEYLDGWAYRQDGTGPDGSAFILDNWIRSGPNVYDGQSTNAGTTPPCPLGTYTATAAQNVMARNDYLNIEMNETGTVNVVSNDVLPNGTFDMISFVSTPLLGGGAITALGELTYIPNTNVCGEDSLSYSICDGADCDTAWVFVDIVCPPTYPFANIGDITNNDASGKPDSIGKTFEIRGIVYGVNFRPGGLQFVLIDDNDDGIQVFSFDPIDNYTVNEGDELTITGAVGFYNGTTQFTPASILIVSTGNDLGTPSDVTVLDESTESQFIRIAQPVSIVDPSDWSNSGTGFNVEVTDGSNTYYMRIDDDCNLFGQNAPTAPFYLTGIGGQYDSSSPYESGYQIFPRYADDLDVLISTNAPEWANEIEVFPNPAQGILNLSNVDQVERIEITNVIGRMVYDNEVQNLNIAIDIGSFPAGHYFIKMSNADAIYTVKFIKK